MHMNNIACAACLRGQSDRGFLLTSTLECPRNNCNLDTRKVSKHARAPGCREQSSVSLRLPAAASASWLPCTPPAERSPPAAGQVLLSAAALQQSHRAGLTASPKCTSWQVSCMSFPIALSPRGTQAGCSRLAAAQRRECVATSFGSW